MRSQRVMMHAIMTVVAGLGVLAVAQAPTVVEAASSPGVGDVCVSFPTVFMENTPGAQQTMPAYLEAGVYEGTIDTQDQYPGRTQTDPATQDSERVEIFGIKTDDLADGVEGHIQGKKGEFTLLTPVTSVTATHISTGSGPNSVYVPLACFRKIADLPVVEPPPSSTTTPPTTEAPTTTVPVTEAPTTAPPTTEAPTTAEAPTTTTPLVEVTAVPPVLPPCAAYPENFVPSYDVNGAVISGLCQLPPGSCTNGNQAIVPGKLSCQGMPMKESG